MVFLPAITAEDVPFLEMTDDIVPEAVYDAFMAAQNAYQTAEQQRSKTNKKVDTVSKVRHHSQLLQTNDKKAKPAQKKVKKKAAVKKGAKKKASKKKTKKHWEGPSR